MHRRGLRVLVPVVIPLAVGWLGCLPVTLPLVTRNAVARTRRIGGQEPGDSRMAGRLGLIHRLGLINRLGFVDRTMAEDSIRAGWFRA